ncbi:Per1-like protein [Helicosporidium sp. ATCC 50920]|nr:Per1-like protein [Helicosporidium sp. ATCC 50920]|eukprot:KDD74866.1 Per1-like protein [Helicosporidium sp. ATCC 50920]
MWAIEDWRHQPRAGARNRATTLPYAPIKYFGKWPFRRVLGAQEPASVLFSLLNLAAQLWWGAWYRRRARRGAEAPSRGRFLTQRQVLAQCALSCNAWLWSAVFHTRDTPFTERADYFAAGLLVVASSYVCLARVFRLSPRVRAGLLTLLLGEYARRVRSMLLLRFDYGRWVAACVAAGGLQTLCWSWWLGWGRRAEGVEGVEREEGTEGALGAEIASQAASATAAGTRRLALFVVLLNAASAFEIADFPPLAAALDAHAAWHLATVPLWGLWYRFAWADHASCRSAAQTGQLKQS